MRSWARIAATAVVAVANRPLSWLHGALGWVLTVGWIALVIGVARPPGVAELTFFGAGFFTSGAWPWNLVALAAGAVLVVAVAVALVALAEATLLRGGRASGLVAARILVLSLVCAVPVAIALLLTLIALAAIALGEFNSPREGGPLLRIAIRLAPWLAGVALAAVAGATVHAAAARGVAAGRSVAAALREAPGRLARAGSAAAIQPLAMLVIRVAYLALVATMLRVLWAPIEERLALDGIDPAVALLLVGFVAIWLCLVLGGGALHAWGSVTWSGVLGGAPDRRMASPHGVEAPTQT